MALATKLLARVAEACAGADLIRAVVKELSPYGTYSHERPRYAFHLRELFERLGTVQLDILKQFDESWKDDPEVRRLRPEYDEFSDAHQAIQIVRRLSAMLDADTVNPVEGKITVIFDTEQWDNMMLAVARFIEKTKLSPIPAPEKPA